MSKDDTPAAELHNTLKKAIEQMQIDSGGFVSMVTVVWDDGKIKEISTQIGATSRYSEKDS